jgi:hypothetical protein
MIAPATPPSNPPVAINAGIIIQGALVIHANRIQSITDRYR